MLGSITTRITLDGPLPPFYSSRAEHAGVLGAVGTRVNNSACVTTQEQQKKDGRSLVCVCIVVVVFGELGCSEGKGVVRE